MSGKQRVHHHKVAPIGEMNGRFSIPIRYCRGRGENPPVVVTGKDQPIGDCTENAVQTLTLCRHAAKEPKVFQYVGIEPRFDMSKKTVTNPQSRL